MSLLLSDSLVGLVDEKALEEGYLDSVGNIQINGKSYEVDAFVTDRKVIRVHAVGGPEDAISILNLRNDIEAKVMLGEESFVASGKIQQIGFEQLPHGGRIVISVILRDK